MEYRSNFNEMKKDYLYQKGFTLIEIIVAVAIFSIVMTICLGAILSLSYESKRAEKMRIAFDNLNFAIENMSRDIRLGHAYKCLPPNESASDCKTVPGQEIEFLDPADNTVKFIYSGDDANICGIAKALCKYDEATATSIEDKRPITSPEIEIDTLEFYVVGSEPGDNIQPNVIIVISGTAGTDPKTRAGFKLQTTVTQRDVDS